MFFSYCRSLVSSKEYKDGRKHPGQRALWLRENDGEKMKRGGVCQKTTHLISVLPCDFFYVFDCRFQVFPLHGLIFHS